MSYDDDDAARMAAFDDDDDNDNDDNNNDNDFGNFDNDNDENDDPSNQITSPKHEPSPYNSPKAEPSPNQNGDSTDEQGTAWEAFQDDEGRTYYYNSKTGESSWEPPPGFAADGEGGGGGEVEGGGEAQQQPEPDEEVDETLPEEGAEEGDEAKGSWVAYQDDEGREYYYNSVTGETQWDKPESYVEAEANATTPVEEDRAKSPVGEEEQERDDQVDNVQEEEEQQPEEEVEEEDPVEKAIREADDALQAPDAILETGCLKHINTLVTHLGGNEGGSKAMQNLVSSYNGQTGVCGLLAAWLTDLTVATSKSKSAQKTPTEMISQGDPFENATNNVRKIAEDVVKKLAIQRFSQTGGDNILNLSKAEAAFLEEMIESDRWRKLLIELSAKNKENALLMYCLQSISKRGHHREIAERINQSDYFGVFNAMLASELSIIGKIAIGGKLDENNGKDISSYNIGNLVTDLKRTCNSTSYTYLYGMEVLQNLVHRASTKKLPDDHRSIGIRRAIRKWERLREDLEEAMVNPTTTGLSPLAKKRRVDIALTISDIHQRQRNRPAPTADDDDDSSSTFDPDRYKNTLETGVINLLKKHSLGMQIDETIADRLLEPQNGESGEKVGEILIAHPSSVMALIGYLFNPGAKRIRSVETRQKCAKLVALAVTAARKAVSTTSNKESNGEQQDNDSADEDQLCQYLLRGSQLCEEIENMVSFTVTEDAKEEENASVGCQLSFLSIKSAPVAYGVIIWSTELASGSDFITSAAYPTLAPCLLSLARIVSINHPFSRQSVLNLALICLKHSAPDLSYQKAQALKQQVLRLLLFLCIQGQAYGVFKNLTFTLKQNKSSEMDSALLRYFVGGCLDIMRPPLSIALVKSMGEMLSTKPCMEALRSQYFPEPKKVELQKLIGTFEKTVKDEEGKALSMVEKEDVTLVLMLGTFYGKKVES